MPQGRVNERIWAKNDAKNKEKSHIFEYLATPIKQYFDLTKNIFLSYLTSSESELTKVMPMMS